MNHRPNERFFSKLHPKRLVSTDNSPTVPEPDGKNSRNFCDSGADKGAYCGSEDRRWRKTSAACQVCGAEILGGGAFGVVDLLIGKGSLRQLTLYLENTRWTAGGNNFDFFSDGKMDMPYHPCLWEAKGIRQVDMIHREGAWVNGIEFSEDLTQIKINGGDGKLKWEGVFTARLDADGKEIPAEYKKP